MRIGMDRDRDRVAAGFVAGFLRSRFGPDTSTIYATDRGALAKKCIPTLVGRDQMKHLPPSVLPPTTLPASDDLNSMLPLLPSLCLITVDTTHFASGFGYVPLPSTKPHSDSGLERFQL